MDRSLTPAEQEVVDLIMLGFSNRELAARRQCSPRTVANQVTAAYRKLGVASRRELHAARHAERTRSWAAEPSSSLTERERQVLAAAEAGQANKCIAYALGIALSTVSSTLTRARRKLGHPEPRPSLAEH